MQKMLTTVNKESKNMFPKTPLRLADLREPAATRCTRSMTEPAARAAAVGVCASFQTFSELS